MERQEIQNYINNFRRQISAFLKPDVGIQSVVYPFNKGVTIVYELAFNLQNKDEIRSESKDIFEALRRTNLFENDNSQSISFSGTNILLIKSKIVIIKDDNPKEWTIDKAKQDIETIVKPSKEKING